MLSKSHDHAGKGGRGKELHWAPAFMPGCCISTAVSPYDPDSRFSMSSLTKLEEGAGINVVTALESKSGEVLSAIGVTPDETYGADPVEVVIFE